MITTIRSTPTFIDLKPDRASLRDAVLHGLTAMPKALPPWLFYDAEGSRLFEAICEQPEYYPTRTELAILRDFGDDIADTLGRHCTVVELGSGSHQKASVLLGLLEQPDGYVAIDISAEPLRHAIARLSRRYPDVPMTGICADFSNGDDLPLLDGTGRGPLVGFFPGSTIGNMSPMQAEAFLADWARRLDGGGMLIGVDLVKDAAVLNRAYNDAAGITAAFNRNMLVRIGRALDTDLDAARFAHRAFYNDGEQRVEMHLVARTAHRVRIEDRGIAFAAGESIHTESSHKYSLDGFRALARRSGFEPDRVWTDPARLFALHYLIAPARS